ncbi:MAG: septum formation initiator family protein [Bacteroidales bacterium]|nr:septum formation initiator family protein [Bacteroidales bacterium]
MKKSPLTKYILWSTLGFLIFIGFIKKNNLINLVNAAFQLKKQEARIEWYREDIDRLENEIEMLTTDRDSLEKFARENFQFARSGDDVYLIDEQR